MRWHRVCRILDDGAHGEEGRDDLWNSAAKEKFRQSVGRVSIDCGDVNEPAESSAALQSYESLTAASTARYLGLALARFRLKGSDLL